jgi:hypothetical protein
MVLRKAVWPNDSRSGVVHGGVCDLGPVEKAQALMPRWRVDIIRKRAEHLGTVEAATEKEHSAGPTQSDCGAEDGQGQGLARQLRELGSFCFRLC